MSFKSLKQKLDDLLGLEEYNDDLDEELDDPVETPPPVFLREEKNRPLPKEKVLIPEEKISITIFTPKNINDCKMPADKIKSGSYAILDYNLTTTTEARQCFYFMQGLIYALDGTCEKISNNIYLYAPTNKRISKKPQPKTSLDDTLRLKW